MTTGIRILESLATIEPADWDALAGGNPTLAHAYLTALHESGSAVPRRGWSPRYLALYEGGMLAGAVPLYAKAHSYGEYVFDWAWAEAHERHGIAYYPKLLAAVPFTPVPGARLLARDDAARAKLAQALVALARESGVSSLHVLFPDEADGAALRGAGLSERTGVQFHWANAGYRDFEDFLAAMSHDKRKKIRQERRRVRDAGVVLRRLSGRDAVEADWDFFFECYRGTYRAHRSTPYLTRDFFRRLAATMPEALLLVIAEQAGEPVAAAMGLAGGGRLLGRYWGATRFVPGLHFEACYYQFVEHAIERGIAVVEGGAQGEHKHARGFSPVLTRSFHWLAHPAFASAVDDFLAREGAGLSAYVDELSERSPFRRGG